MAAGVIPASGNYITLAGVALCMSEWEVEFDGGLIDATTFCDGGFSDRISTIKDAHISVRGFWDVRLNLHAIPPNITGGASIANLILGVKNAAADGAPLIGQYTFPLVIVDKVHVVSAVRDALKLDFECYNRGPWTYLGL